MIELFCGRGNGLAAWESLGFSHIEGVDRSPRLLSEYRGNAMCSVADCREIPVASSSRDVAAIHGGLHHLERLPQDLEDVVGEVRRILKPGGRLLIVEPWQTPFLALVHECCRRRVVRKLWRKLDALAEMTELEASTYFSWLAQPEVVLESIHRAFEPVRMRIAFGKLFLLAQPR
ncbi:MAG: class I SAM-dependent methyltransferase [Planctomyces sp.]|nr:class I SAM-dependent methyltransferase [Planctomyces sp.]